MTTTTALPAISRPTISPRSQSVPSHPHRPAPQPPSHANGTGNGSGHQKRPKSLLSRFKRSSAYDLTSDPTLDQIPTLERMSSSSVRHRHASMIEKPMTRKSKEKERGEEDIDWEKVKTLPRVCLTPPEGMSSPIQSRSPLQSFSCSCPDPRLGTWYLVSYLDLMIQRTTARQSLSTLSFPQHLPLAISIYVLAQPPPSRLRTIRPPYEPLALVQAQWIHPYGQEWPLDSSSPLPNSVGKDNP